MDKEIYIPDVSDIFHGLDIVAEGDRISINFDFEYPDGCASVTLGEDGVEMLKNYLQDWLVAQCSRGQ